MSDAAAGAAPAGIPPAMSSAALSAALAGRRLLFLGGKGGTGKTTLAATIALAEARRGRRVLLVSTDPAHNLAHLFERAIGPTRVAVAPRLDALELDPDATVDEHLGQTRGFLRRLMTPRLHSEIDRHLEQSRQAPGMIEAALLESIARTIEEGRDAYDLIVFDTAPSGHTARLMALPEMMAAWTEGLIASRARSERLSGAARVLGAAESAAGTESRDAEIRAVLYRRRKRFATLRDALSDALGTGFLIVLTAERLPVLETIELHRRLIALGVAVPALLVNKRAPAGEGEFLETLRRQERTRLDALAAALPGLPLVHVAMQPGEPAGLDALVALGTRFRDGARESEE